MLPVSPASALPARAPAPSPLLTPPGEDIHNLPRISPPEGGSHRIGNPLLLLPPPSPNGPAAGLNVGTAGDATLGRTALPSALRSLFAAPPPIGANLALARSTWARLAGTERLTPRAGNLILSMALASLCEGGLH